MTSHSMTKKKTGNYVKFFDITSITPLMHMVKMDIIKDRNGMALTEIEDIKKRWKEYIEELYKKRY